MIRIPQTDNKSLQAWNAADELLLHSFNTIDYIKHSILVINDRFGYLNLHLKCENIFTYIDSKSQMEAIGHNIQGAKKTPTFILKNDPVPQVNAVYIQIPKSLDVLQAYLDLAYDAIVPDGIIYLGFMTKHFTSSYLSLSNQYFTNVSQSKAVKKARVLTLTNKTEIKPKVADIKKVQLADGKTPLVQYSGVFSNDHIDYATQFLLEHLKVRKDEKTILDLGSGNGIISYHINTTYENKEIHLLEDSYLAYLSGKLNLDCENIEHHWDYNLENFADNQFDLIVTNPPFHFGHEIDLSIPMNLIKNTRHIIKPNGRLIIVSNNHINYTNLLNEFFTNSHILASNNKFNIWEAIK